MFVELPVSHDIIAARNDLELKLHNLLKPKQNQAMHNV